MRCGEGAEVGGAGGVVGGADAEVEIDGEEEVQLQRVELREGDAADLRPAMEAESCRVEESDWVATFRVRRRSSTLTIGC